MNAKLEQRKQYDAWLRPVDGSAKRPEQSQVKCYYSLTFNKGTKFEFEKQCEVLPGYKNKFGDNAGYVKVVKDAIASAGSLKVLKKGKHVEHICIFIIRLFQNLRRVHLKYNYAVRGSILWEMCV